MPYLLTARGRGLIMGGGGPEGIGPRGGIGGMLDLCGCGGPTGPCGGGGLIPGLIPK